jgi:hypothetical protein
MLDPIAFAPKEAEADSRYCLCSVVSGSGKPKPCLCSTIYGAGPVCFCTVIIGTG